MRTTLRRLAAAVAVLVLILFGIFMVNQTAQLVLLADRISPVFGSVVLWSLIGLYAACLALPIFLFVRLPKALVHPDPDDLEGIKLYRRALVHRLRQNAHLQGHILDSEEDIGPALALLSGKASEATRRAAAQVFLTTAISQNGSLDAIVVLAAQSRLVLEIARIYDQRPRIQQLAWLYANVAGTAFAASSLEEIDISQQVQPLVSSVAGSAMSAIPGFQAATSVFVNSVLNGSANAFLTLRIGVIARQYCESVEKPARGRVRKSAVAQATRMLSGIVLEGTRKISGAMVSASTRPMREAVSKVNEIVRTSASATSNLLRRPWTKSAAEPGDEAPDTT